MKSGVGMSAVGALCVIFAAGVDPAHAQAPGKLSVAATGVRNDNGAVRCGLYSSPNGFREPGREMRGAVAHIKNGHATCVFNGIPAGTYAVAVFHAENKRNPDGEPACSASPSRATGFPATHPRPSARPASTARHSNTRAATTVCRSG